ncbi:uncharacterized protein [Mytilus edulis]|uniref:uncharacterized protein n=1 Tax=Mytilus edulis TaxID=6550 RepID=UPI0039EF3472
MDLMHRFLYSAFLNLIISVWEANSEYCYYVYSYYYRYYYYECETSGGTIAGAVIGAIIFVIFIAVFIAVCKNKNRTRVTTIHTAPHHGGPTIITQQQQQHGHQPMMYGQYPQPGGVMYNQPPAYPPPQANYPPPQGNYPPKY